MHAKTHSMTLFAFLCRDPALSFLACLDTAKVTCQDPVRLLLLNLGKLSWLFVALTQHFTFRFASKWCSSALNVKPFIELIFYKARGVHNLLANASMNAQPNFKGLFKWCLWKQFTKHKQRTMRSSSYFSSSADGRSGSSVWSGWF